MLMTMSMGLRIDFPAPPHVRVDFGQTAASLVQIRVCVSAYELLTSVVVNEQQSRHKFEECACVYIRANVSRHHHNHHLV